MNKSRYILLVLLALSFRGTLFAQTYGDVYKRNFWNASANVSGIRQDSLSRSFAKISGSYTGGGFKDPSDAPDLWSAGVETASIRHLEKISFRGAFGFKQTEFYSMCGSMLVNPGSYPVDILEFTPGRKTRQIYSFDGGVSYDAAPNWRIGAAMNFCATNLAKRKDLRHSNLRLEFQIVPGFMYHNGKLALGISAIFMKNSESVFPEQVGTSESSYYAFLDKGMMFGSYGPWNGGALHLFESGVDGFPLREYGYGGAAEFQYGGLFVEAGYTRTSGRAGEKENIWFRFPGNKVNVKAGYSGNGHFARLNLGWKGQQTEETVLEKVSENGVQTVRETGSNIVAERELWTLAPEYEYICGFWEILAGISLEKKMEVSATMYPYLFTREVSTAEAHLTGTIHPGAFDIRLTAGCRFGRVSEGSSVQDEESGVQTSPFRLEEWYALHKEWLSAPGVEAALSIRYNFSKGLYLEAGASILHGFRLSLMNGSNRISAGIGIGYEF